MNAGTLYTAKTNRIVKGTDNRLPSRSVSILRSSHVSVLNCEAKVYIPNDAHYQLLKIIRLAQCFRYNTDLKCDLVLIGAVSNPGGGGILSMDVCGPCGLALCDWHGLLTWV